MYRWVIMPMMLVWIGGTAGCGTGDNGGGAARTLNPAEMTEVQKQQQQVALAARDAMFEQLLGKLMEVLGAAGPAAAIDVCRREAPQIAVDVGRQYGVAIGRTSQRLRNPKNAPPDWAKPLVRSQAGEPRFLALDDGQLAALLPIRLKAQCLMCHGSQEEMLPDVRQALARHYPEDQATGFREGDLRGWFWVTVPRDAQLPTISPEPAAPAGADTATET
jgi:hypothetical protein